MKKLAMLLFLCGLSLQAQTNRGELNLKVTDPSGQGVKAAVQVSSEANQYRAVLQTDSQGNLLVEPAPLRSLYVGNRTTRLCPVYGDNRRRFFHSHSSRHST